MEDSKSAEELIVEVLRQKNLRQNARLPIEKVIMSADMYRLIQQYRARLGELPDASLDYLTKYSLFGLPIFVDNETGELRVE